MTKIDHQKEAVKPIPPFATVEEEADFWDTHSAVDQIEKDTPVGFHRSRKSDSLTIRFEPEDIQRIREEANQIGIGPTTLARMWILKHLPEKKGHPSHR